VIQARAKQREAEVPDALEVWLDDGAVGPLAHMGRLHKAGPHTVRFEYSPAWLKHPMAFALDPELGLADGNFFPKDSNLGSEAQWNRKGS
jgi:hypothetical protein